MGSQTPVSSNFAVSTDSVEHIFIVTNAKFYGDPDATVYSYGKTDWGLLGRVDDSTTNEMSAGTAQADREAWLSTGYLVPQAGVFGTTIPASDAAVDEAAGSLVWDQKYEPVPTVSGANSNGAASAVADRAAGSHVPTPGSGQRTPVGVSSSSRIHFNGSSSNGSKVDQKVKAMKDRAKASPVIKFKPSNYSMK